MKRFVAIFAIVMVIFAFCSVAVMADDSDDYTYTLNGSQVYVEYVITTVTKPTCTDDGDAWVHLSTDSRNGIYADTDVEVVIEALGHVVAWETTHPTSCDYEGLYTAYCSRCKEYLAQVNGVYVAVDKENADTHTGTGVAHNYVYTVINPATCVDSGTAEYICSWCGHEATYNDLGKTPAAGKRSDDVYTETIAATGVHSYGDKQVRVKATCTSQGVDVYVCEVCGAEKVETTAMLAHTYAIADKELTDCETVTLTWECTVCGAETVSTVTGDFHDWVESEDDAVAATCTEAGSRYYVCSVCGEEKTEVVKALGHSYSTNTTVYNTYAALKAVDFAGWLDQGVYSSTDVDDYGNVSVSYYHLYYAYCTRGCGAILRMTVACNEDGNLYSTLVSPYDYNKSLNNASAGEPGGSTPPSDPSSGNENGKNDDNSSSANTYALDVSNVTLDADGYVTGAAALVVVGDADEEVYVRVSVLYANANGDTLLMYTRALVDEDGNVEIPYIAPSGYTARAICFAVVTTKSDCTTTGAYTSLASASATF